MNATILSLDAPRPIVVSQVYVVATATPGLYTLSETAPSAAYFEQVSPGLFGLTDAPGAGRKAQLVLIGTLATMVG